MRQALYAPQTDSELPMLVKLAWKAGSSCPCPCLWVLELQTCTPIPQALKSHFCGTAMLSQVCLKSSTFLQLRQQQVISYGTLCCLWLFVSIVYLCTSLAPPEYNFQRTYSRWHLIMLLYRMYLIC